MKAERPPSNIEQQYEYATNLDRYWRKSKRKKESERKKERKKCGNQGQR